MIFTGIHRIKKTNRLQSSKKIYVIVIEKNKSDNKLFHDSHCGVASTVDISYLYYC